MRWAFIFDDMAKDEFDAAYPKHKDSVGSTSLGGSSSDNWVTDDHVRIAEYFRVVEKTDRSWCSRTRKRRGDDGQGLGGSCGPEGALDTVVDDPAPSRTVKYNQVEWFLIIGDKVAERRDWPGRYIPIVRVPGEETVIDGEMDRKGHVRALKDAQRMYNWNASAQVEFGAMQSKIPYTAPVEAIEGLETYWETANTVNHSILPYNHSATTAAGTSTRRSARCPPPAPRPSSSACRSRPRQMMEVSGQYEASVGAQGNERSGVAIQQRQRQGDNATYHFIDHLAMAIRFTGKIIIDLAPHIYDRKRLIHIMAEDGTTTR
jgi:hypothetical protein